VSDDNFAKDVQSARKKFQGKEKNITTMMLNDDLKSNYKEL
jgi:hypothetical protein